MIAVLDNRYQKATRWVKGASTDGFSPGSWTKTSITVRWEDRAEVFLDNTGSEIRSRAVVYSGIDLSIGDYLALGTSTSSDPTSLSSAYEIKDFQKLPDLRGNFYLRRILL